MVWCAIAAALIGAGIGLRFRAPAMVAGSAVAAVATALVAVLGDRPWLPWAVAAAGSLQIGYLVGVSVVTARRGRRDR